MELCHSPTLRLWKRKFQNLSRLNTRANSAQIPNRNWFCWLRKNWGNLAHKQRYRVTHSTHCTIQHTATFNKHNVIITGSWNDYRYHRCLWGVLDMRQPAFGFLIMFVPLEKQHNVRCLVRILILDICLTVCKKQKSWQLKTAGNRVWNLYFNTENVNILYLFYFGRFPALPSSHKML